MNRYTNSDGTFSVQGLAAGSYKVAFNRSSGYTTEEAQFYNNKPESAGVAQAQSIVVGAGQSIPNVNATLVQGGSITGTATDQAGKPVSGAGVEAFTLNGSLVARTGVTDAAGKYTIPGLSTGQYVVRLRGSTPLLGDLYSGNSTSEAAATPVAVAVGKSTALNLDYATASLTTAVPTITGTAKVGSVLTAVPGTWGPSPVTLVYQWKASGIAITGATASTYKPVAADTGKAITVSVTGTKAGYTGAVKTSAATGTVMALNPVLTAPAPTITGTVKVGSVLTAVPGTWGPSPVTLAYQWKASGIAITGATASTYKPVAADAGKAITVTVTGTKAGYTTAAKTSVATAAVARGTLTAPAPTITGTVKVGSVLTAVPGTWGPSPVTLAYQWKTGGIAITGATASTYRPAAANVGKTITVTVTGSKTGYTSAAKTSVATAAVAKGTLTAPVPTITGTAKVGQLLTAAPGHLGTVTGNPGLPVEGQRHRHHRRHSQHLQAGRRQRRQNHDRHRHRIQNRLHRRGKDLGGNSGGGQGNADRTGAHHHGHRQGRPATDGSSGYLGTVTGNPGLPVEGQRHRHHRCHSPHLQAGCGRHR